MANFNSFNPSVDTKKKKDQMDVSLANMDKATADYNKMNYGSFVQGDDYKALSQRYQQNGQMAMKDTLGQMAARTGGMASSYANTASQQAYNGYMEKLEDAARSLYDSQRQEKMDALSVATSIYNRDNAAYESGYANDYNKWRADVGDQQWQAEQDYQADQDAKADATALKSEWITTISNAAYNADGLDYNTYKDNIPKDANGNPIISKAEFNAIVNAAVQGYKSDTWEQTNAENANAEADADARIESYIHNGSWQWGDWDNDGMVGEYDTDGEGFADEFFAGSSQGENYWKNIHDKYKEDAKVKGYTYQKTAEGAAGIFNKLADSASLSLSENDQDNFDYIYGDGTYDAVQDVITAIKDLQPTDSGLDTQFDSSFEGLSSIIPGLTVDQLCSILLRANPEAYNAWTAKSEQTTPTWEIAYYPGTVDRQQIIA